MGVLTLLSSLCSLTRGHPRIGSNNERGHPTINSTNHGCPERSDESPERSDESWVSRTISIRSKQRTEWVSRTIRRIMGVPNDLVSRTISIRSTQRTEAGERRHTSFISMDYGCPQFVLNSWIMGVLNSLPTTWAVARGRREQEYLRGVSWIRFASVT